MRNRDVKRTDLGRNLRLDDETVVAGSVRIARRIRLRRGLLHRWPKSYFTDAEPTHRLVGTGNLSTATLAQL